ncbi:haloacid dehalogenase type II [Pseudaestuariivita rosea]|uniref:haloacid dehalogenase type II n=1 Tax=Pseudaestuariivita rosea TaxID=2763263 RepID=UPI001ABAA115|nr:haloacid dehalogenase type II [Pseudaestuariivita rosea]
MLITTCVFAAYGTLFDVNAAAAQAATEPEHKALSEVWPSVARDWRSKQSQYTWLRTIADRYCDFWQITKESLDWAMQANGLTDNAPTYYRLLELYWKLDAYPEAYDMLQALKARGLTTAILSNGTAAMLDGAISLAGVGGMLDAVLSAEDIEVFKPHAKVYDMVGQRFGCVRRDVLFVSSNGWDVAGAGGYGFKTVWVNRRDEPEDLLCSRAGHVLPDLTKIPDLI